MQSVGLNASTYSSTAGRLAIFDGTGNPDAADFRYIVSQLNASVVISGLPPAAGALDDPPGQDPSSAGIWTGNYSQLLQIGPNLAALHIEQLSWSQVTVRVLYNDTAQHSLPIVLNLLSNALYRMNGM